MRLCPCWCTHLSRHMLCRLQHLQVGASTLSAGGLDRLLTAAPLLQRLQASGSTFQLVVVSSPFLVHDSCQNLCQMVPACRPQTAPTLPERSWWLAQPGRMVKVTAASDVARLLHRCSRTAAARSSLFMPQHAALSRLLAQCHAWCWSLLKLEAEHAHVRSSH